MPTTTTTTDRANGKPMPEYRKLHHCFDMGERTSQLSDFEFRVWNVYRAAADDFGVCPMLPSTLKGNSRRLAAVNSQGRAVVSDHVVLKAMERLIEVGLALVFDHQGLRYLCQPDWQDWEDIRYPRRSQHPAPPVEVFGKLSEKTQKLFSEKFPKNFGNVSETFQDFSRLPRAGGREAPTLTETETQTQAQASGKISRNSFAAHDQHVSGFCDWKCFFLDQFEEFAHQLGKPIDEAREHVQRWAQGVRDAWTGAGRVPADRPYDFWRYRWQEAHGGSAPTPRTGKPANGNADSWDQHRKTAELNRLLREGVPRPDALKRAGF